LQYDSFIVQLDKRNVAKHTPHQHHTSPQVKK
jgi:hypothetical protein